MNTEEEEREAPGRGWPGAGQAAAPVGSLLVHRALEVNNHYSTAESRTHSSGLEGLRECVLHHPQLSSQTPGEASLELLVSQPTHRSPTMCVKEWGKAHLTVLPHCLSLQPVRLELATRGQQRLILFLPPCKFQGLNWQEGSHLPAFHKEPGGGGGACTAEPKQTVGLMHSLSVRKETATAFGGVGAPAVSRTVFLLST